MAVEDPIKVKAASAVKAARKPAGPAKMPAPVVAAAPAAPTVKPSVVESPVVKPPVVEPSVEVPAVAVPAVAGEAAAPKLAPEPEPAKLLPSVAAKAEPKPKTPKSLRVVKFAPAALPPVKKGKAIMAVTIQPKPQAAAEKVTLMIADLNNRAKTAFEKTAKAGEELTEFTKGNMEAFATSAKTAAKGAEALGQELADYGKKSFEAASATMKSLASVKTPTELFQIQSDYAKASFDSAVAEASKLSEVWLKLAGDVFQPISGRYAIAAEKIKSVAA